MTYTSFCTPQKLLEKLIERYHVPVPETTDSEAFRRTTQRPIQLRVCNTMKHWMDHHWQDFDHDLAQASNFGKNVANVRLASREFCR